MTIIAKRPGARLPAAAQRDLVVHRLERIAIAIQQNQPLRVLNVVRTVFLRHNGWLCFFRHRVKYSFALVSMKLAIKSSQPAQAAQLLC